MSNQQFIDRHHASMVLNYGKLPAALVRGQGSLLWDADGKEYIDMFAGFGGTILGHQHPALVSAVVAQATCLWCTGNQFYTEPQLRLAESLKRLAFDGRAFFCHSGAEANEAAIKLARISAGLNGKEGRFKIISMQQGFHGRTLGALSATPTLEYQKGFFPLVPGFANVPYDDLAALEAAIDADTCAVITEPIQGEAGINVPSDGFLKGVREICDKHHLAMIVDEVWTGIGRTGKNFGYQYGGVTPDIISMGKALGGGLPVGGILAKPERAAFFKPGTHGCTLGGNPICAAAGAAVLATLEKENLSARAAALGEKVVARVKAFSPAAASKIKEVRGRGLFLGIELVQPDASALVPAALAKGLALNVTHKHIVRLAPALTIPEDLAMKGLDILEQAIAAL
jgi:predicted acetylornithine/succinylornithine family transaminase